jgi:hypothetical protein
MGPAGSKAGCCANFGIGRWFDILKRPLLDRGSHFELGGGVSVTVQC